MEHLSFWKTHFLSLRTFLKNRSWQDWAMLGVFCFAAISNAVWIIQNQSPPIWDMAGHSHRAVAIAQYMEKGYVQHIFGYNTIYPPLSYMITGTGFLLFGFSQDIPQWSLLFWLAIYCASMYVLLTALFRDRTVALVATTFSLLLPEFAHFTRIYDLDFPLTAWIVAALASLVKSQQFTRRGWSVVFGFTFAAAFLTKWTALIFLLPLILWELRRSFFSHESRIQRIRNILIIAGIQAILVIPWYARHAVTILASAYDTRHNIFSVPTEQLWGWENVSYYLEKVSRGITPVIAGIFVMAILVMFWKRSGNRFVALWIFVPYFLMTFFFYSKESRYLLPVYPAIAAVIIAAFGSFSSKIRWTIWGLILAIGLFFWTETSWGIHFFPENIYRHPRVERMYGYYFPKFYTSPYGFVYPTQYGKSLPLIVERLSKDLTERPRQKPQVRIAVVPNSIFLTAQQVQYLARLQNVDNLETPYHLEYALSTFLRSSEWEKFVLQADYLITKTGDQGPRIWAGSAWDVAAEEQRVDSEIFSRFELLESWPYETPEEELQTARLYRRR